MHYPNFSQEKELWSQGYKNIAGIDEAGRGAWAGPVVAAAAILTGRENIKGLKDSKLLSPKKRATLFVELTAKIVWGVGIIAPAQIDELNILVATRLAMKQALANLSCSPDFTLIDAVRIGDLNCRQRAVIKGDRKIMSIAAASIIAKVTRDNLLINLHQTYPQYGFDVHKGYGTKLHREKLAVFGPCPLHRMSYRPLRKKFNKNPAV
jgi:ribonuclease HII